MQANVVAPILLEVKNITDYIFCFQLYGFTINMFRQQILYRLYYACLCCASANLCCWEASGHWAGALSHSDCLLLSVEQSLLHV